MTHSSTGEAPVRASEAAFYRTAALDHLLHRGRPSASPRFAQKEALAVALRQRDGFTTPRAAQPLPEIEGPVDRARFFEATEGLRRPLVVRGFAAQTKAVRSWTEQRLREELGTVPCAVYLQDEESRKESWDRGTKMLSMPFAEFLDRRHEEPLYLNNATELFLARPELLDELGIDAVREAAADPVARWDELVTANLFVGGTRVFSAVHCAYAGNLFTQVAGRKRWVFVDPRFGPHLHAIPGTPFQYLKSAYGGSRAQEELGQGPNHALACLPRFEVVLEPGDLLYSAPWWWHEVDNLDEFTIGVALRHMRPPIRKDPSFQNHRFWSMVSRWPIARTATAFHWALSQIAPRRVPSARALFGERQARLLRAGLGK